MTRSHKKRIRKTIHELEQQYPILQKPERERMSIGAVRRILSNALHRLADEYEADDRDDRLARVDQVTHHSSDDQVAQ